jgi:tuftelin-interacting protein 11
MNAFGGGSSSDESDEDQDDFLHPSTDPNADEFADYNPRKRRRTGRDPKESAALGIFGSESEDEGPGKKWKSKNIRSKGMAFVKPGQKLGGSDDDDEYDEEVDNEDNGHRKGLGASADTDEDVDMEDVEEDPKPRMGLGASSSTGRGLGSGGLGWQSPAIKRVGLGTINSSPLGRGFVPSSAAVPILLERDDDKPSTPRAALPSAFSTPTGGKYGKSTGNDKKAPVNAGSFAARMMAKMGYKEGTGLGKEGQGRSGVIEVQLRPQGVGLGAVREKSQQERSEERRQAVLRGEVLEDSEEEEKKRRRKPKTSGTDSGTSTPKRPPKTKYQSLPEIQRAAPGLHIPDAFTPILDMTVPGHRLLTSTSGLLTPTGAPESTELVAAKKLARQAQRDLGSFVEEWKNLQERKAWVEMEILQQRQAVDEQTIYSDQLSSVASIVQGLSETVRDGQWDPVIKALVDVDGLGVAGNDEIASIAVAAVHPFFRQSVEGWQPLEDPKLSGIASAGFAPALHSIRHLLGMDLKGTNGNAVAVRNNSTSNGTNHARAHKSTPYESMMYNVWLPKVRSAITNHWDVQDPAPVQVLLEAWDGLLPDFIRSQILDQLVVRKLEEAVAAWNPKKKRHTLLPHLWLFPWLQYLPAHHADPKSSTGLVSDVKRKFRQLIDSWDFRRGVIPGLQQWREVLQPRGQSNQWTPLIINHVLPNLSKFLRTNFQVAPQDQEPYMPILNSTLEWQEILGPKIMGQLIVDEIFPMWHDVLHQWLILDGVNYEEVGAWFEFWTGIIPENINAVPAVKAEWQKGEHLINQALDLGPNAKSDLPAPPKVGRSQLDEMVTAKDLENAATATPTKSAPEVEEVTFKQQLEDWCIAHELQFIPERSTLEANGPVYRITAAPIGKGGVLIYLRGDSIHAQIKRGVWSPLGKEMDALFELAHR